MPLKTIDQSPTITDTIRFQLDCPDTTGCLLADPYMVYSVSIYYLERNFLGTNWGQYDNVIQDGSLLQEIQVLQSSVCQNPNDADLLKLQSLQKELASTAQTDTIYYKEAAIVETIGDDRYPAWLSTDQPEAVLTKVETDAKGNVVHGKFTLDWSPNGSVREGDYVLCWTWQPLPGRDRLSNRMYFSLYGDGRAATTIPTHVTPPDKYETLLERYLPEVYKQEWADGDLTPQVTDLLNRSVAQGFSFIEDLANQLIDLYDANVLHGSMLQYLGNLFDLRFKSEDITLWRRQVKEAIPLFKKKGTIGGLQQAFAQAGMRLDKYSQLWQVVSPYTWTESFLVADSPSFKLGKVPLATITANFYLAIRRLLPSGGYSDTYDSYPIDCVLFEEKNYEQYVTWVGDEKSVNPVTLYAGDILLIKYQYREMPTGGQQIEEYIQSLSLADTRDEIDQEFPPKNWNVHLIEEDDPMFEVVIPSRHPFCDPLVFGHIRTEFPYSENIYNMEEYNGSKRESFDPCWMDKEFLDPCGNCLSSKYNVDLTVNELSDDRIHEIRDILREYTPFITVPHVINFCGEITEFAATPVEQIDFLIHFTYTDDFLSGEGNPVFHRIMTDAVHGLMVDRDALANQTKVVSTTTGTAFNDRVVIVAPNVVLSDIGINEPQHVLEVMSGIHKGDYQIDNMKGTIARVTTSVHQPLSDGSGSDSFPFRLSNIIYSTLNGASITQRDRFLFSDTTLNLSELDLKTQWDVDNYKYVGQPWQIRFPTLDLTVDICKVDGNTLYLEGLPDDEGVSVTYDILDDDGNVVISSTSGYWTVRHQGQVTISDPGAAAQNQLVQHGDYLSYDDSGTWQEHLVDVRRVDGDLIIENYDAGGKGGVTVRVMRRLLDNETGYFEFQGLGLETTVDYEASLGILNGSSHHQYDETLVTDNGYFKENFLVRIYSDDLESSNYYRVEDIAGTTITLSGLPQDWTTKASDPGGKTVTFEIYQFTPKTVNVQWYTFDKIDRSGKDMVVREIESNVTGDIAMRALSLPEGTNFKEVARQDEGVAFEIEYKDGHKENHEL